MGLEKIAQDTAISDGATAASTGRGLVSLIFLLLAIVVVVTAALVFVAVRGQEGTARHFALQRAHTAVAQSRQQLIGVARDFAFWTRSYDGVTEPNDDRRKGEFLQWSSSMQGISAGFVLGARDEVIWRYSDGTGSAYTASELYGAELDGLVAAVRTLVRDASVDFSEHHRWGYLSAGSEVHLVVVKAFDWGATGALPSSGEESVLILAKKMQPSLFHGVWQSSLLSNLRLIAPEGISQHPDANSVLPLLSPSGEALGAFVWTTDLLGVDLVRILAIPLILCLIVSVAIGWFILIRLRRANDEAQRWLQTSARTNEELADREAQAQEAKRAAEVANHAKTEFLANMSHELRTPLNAVIGFAELIGEEIAGPLGSDKYKEYSGDIRASGEHLLEIINEILDLSKIEAGRMTLLEDTFSVERVVTNSIRLVQERARSGDVALASEVHADLPYLRGDERMVRQLLTNFLSNAVKFTPEGGSVHVEAMQLLDGSIQIEVADTGIGMSEEEMETSMQPFRQISSSLARKHEGTGLGLPLAKSFIDLHSGSLNIESEAGVGTTIRVTFPPYRSISRSGLTDFAGVQ